MSALRQDSPRAGDPGISNLAAVVRPVQQRLALALATHQVAGLAVLLDLPHVAADRFPAFDLAAILVGHPATHVVAAIPLEPTARIVGMQPALLAPDRERLTGVDAEEIERAVAPLGRELGAGEPALRKFLARVGHVLAAEHAERQHLKRGQLRIELGIEMAARWRAPHIAIARLHFFA